MKKVTQNSLHIFDNEGTSVDRYTVVMPNGVIYGCSSKPGSPVGVGTFSHNTDAQAKDFTYEGKSEFVKEAQADPSWIGKEISFEEAPEDIQKFIDIKFQTAPRITHLYIYPLCHPDGEMFGKVRSDCPPCRIDHFQKEFNERIRQKNFSTDDYSSTLPVHFWISRFMDMLKDKGYYASHSQEDEQPDVTLNI